LEIDHDRQGEVAHIKTTPDGNFVFIGIPLTSSIGIYYFD